VAQSFSIEEARIDLVADGPQLTEGRQCFGRQEVPDVIERDFSPQASLLFEDASIVVKPGFGWISG
jgi:hypothetical protein